MADPPKTEVDSWRHHRLIVCFDVGYFKEANVLSSHPPGQSNQAVDHQAIELAMAEAMRIDLRKSWSALVMFGVACVATASMYRHVLPLTTAVIWAGCVIMFLLIWAGYNVHYGLRPPDTTSLLKTWAPRTRAIVLVSNGLVIATVWLFLPLGSHEDMLTMLVFYMAMPPTQMLASPENSSSVRLGATALFGSILLYLGRYPTPQAPCLVLFIGVYGGLMYLFATAQGELVLKSVLSDMKSTSLARQLEVSLADLLVANEAKTRFVEAASHDLVQPLQASRLFLNAVMHAGATSQREQAAEGIRQAITRVETQLTDMLHCLRLNANEGFVQKPEPVVLGTAMCSAAFQFLPMAEEKGIALNVVPSRVQLTVDSTLLHRALANLLDNALKHSQASRILVVCRITAERRLRIWVLDNGVGIPRHEAPLLFNSYFQGAAVRDTQVGGFGLGLASVRRMAELMGGTAGLDERWINGAAFYLELPLPGEVP